MGEVDHLPPDSSSRFTTGSSVSALRSSSKSAVTSANASRTRWEHLVDLVHGGVSARLAAAEHAARRLDRDGRQLDGNRSRLDSLRCTLLGTVTPAQLVAGADGPLEWLGVRSVPGVPRRGPLLGCCHGAADAGQLLLEAAEGAGLPVDPVGEDLALRVGQRLRHCRGGA